MLLQESNRFNMHVIDKLMDNGREHKRQKKNNDERSSKRVNSISLEPISIEYSPTEWKGKKPPKRSKIVYTQIRQKDIKSCIRKILCPFDLNNHG